jgi:hypothetical protein
MFKTITQGGQVHIHQLLMLKQVLIVGTAVAFLIGAGYFAWEARIHPTHAWRMTYETYWAHFMLATVPKEKHKGLMQLHMPLQGSAYQPRKSS